ncbi:HNH endonuclease [Mesorhizobium sp. B2-5-9]|uniref:HNH endonuclease n=1 Tax=Mesorhizobium sp. B2-5-9 TaxID=2589921 RepID=UPI00112E7C77|nr:HNH endonuclease [Mesorhizobium sp. B2-5-9]TPJ97631.1 HNH endonuclease [Mesorhizobium sp. B2-5-9]
MITQESLKEILHYDPVTGIFTWLVAKSMSVKVGMCAGTQVGIGGHVRIKIDGTSYYAHRLAWLYVHGKWPNGDLDHRNVVKSHNWVANLREATPSQNRANAPLRPDNSSGFKGVYWRPERGLWHAQIRKDGKCYHLGYFAAIEAAAEAYRIAALDLHGEFARAA